MCVCVCVCVCVYNTHIIFEFVNNTTLTCVIEANFCLRWSAGRLVHKYKPSSSCSVKLYAPKKIDVDNIGQSCKSVI
jgi:hypothetical protein